MSESEDQKQEGVGYRGRGRRQCQEHEVLASVPHYRTALRKAVGADNRECAACL